MRHFLELFAQAFSISFAKNFAITEDTTLYRAYLDSSGSAALLVVSESEIFWLENNVTVHDNYLINYIKFLCFTVSRVKMVFNVKGAS